MSDESAEEKEEIFNKSAEENHQLLRTEEQYQRHRGVIDVTTYIWINCKRKRGKSANFQKCRGESISCSEQKNSTRGVGSD